MTLDMRSAWSHQETKSSPSQKRLLCFLSPFCVLVTPGSVLVSKLVPIWALSFSRARARSLSLSLSLTHGRWAPESTTNGKTVLEIPVSCLGFRRASKGVGVFWKRSPSEPAWTQSEHGCKAPGCWMRTRPRRGKRPPGLRLHLPRSERGLIGLLLLLPALVFEEPDPDCGGLSLSFALLLSFSELWWVHLEAKFGYFAKAHLLLHAVTSGGLKTTGLNLMEKRVIIAG